MRKEKYLIINVDDFGVSHAANVAARDLYNTGKVTSLSVMAGANAYNEAVSIIKEDKIESVGVHLYVTNEYPGEKNAFRLKGLNDSASCRSSLAFTNDFLYSDKYLSETQSEAKAQIEKVLQDGITPTHIDNHMYSLWPRDCNDFFETACKFCKSNGIKAIRLSSGFRELPAYYGVFHMTRIERLCARAVAQKYGVKTVDYVYLMTQKDENCFAEDKMLATFKEFLEMLPEGVSEMHFHPAAENDELKENNPWWQERVAEYNLFKNNDIRAICAEYGIKLISYKELADMERPKVLFPKIMSKILKKLDFIKF